MSNIIITTIEKSGGDLVFNNIFSVPKLKITITKRVEGFCTCRFDQKYYSDVEKFHISGVSIYPANVTKPAGVIDNDTLFEKLVQLKTP